MNYNIVFLLFDGTKSKIPLENILPNYKDIDKCLWASIVHEKMHDHPIQDDSICMEIVLDEHFEIQQSSDSQHKR